MNSQMSTEDTSQRPQLPERDIWVHGNLNSMSRVYGSSDEEVVMNRQSRRSVSTRSSSVNNYDSRTMTIRLNESVSKAVEDAREEELCKNIEEDVTAKLTAQFNNHWAEKKVALKNELAHEKAVREQERKKKSKISELWSLYKSWQQSPQRQLQTRPIEKMMMVKMMLMRRTQPTWFVHFAPQCII
ncbi:hypothetical protein Cgig2_031296 [Carnegiea gigantea]|uniref:Uncharacterized protein n=1 Tax=Carnegiea gigantea TaxID=171969 RepID=A0A9Q1QK05_9CARY|nr:hypothetical protein Cgig2_031296 [Carnegiea gigantea]